MKHLTRFITFVFFCILGLPAELQAKNASSQIYLIEFNGSVNPGSEEFYNRALAQAQSDSAMALLVELDTPGGLVTSLRGMVKATMASPVPVIVYVAPSGAQAASAGALLTLSAHVAAMAPGTNIGAAHPVGIGGGGSDSIMSQKSENDIAAFARSIAEERGRNADWAESAVRSSTSSTAMDAKEAGVIDFIAVSREDLLQKLNNFKLALKEDTLTLITTGVTFSPLEPNLRENILMKIADPNLAYIFMLAGLIGLYFELSNPGAIFPGVLGAISLLLGLYAVQTLPVNVVGLLLLLLAVVFLALEIFITSGGILGVAGLVSLLFGSLMLFDKAETGISISLSVLAPTFISFSIFMGLIIFMVTKASKLKTTTGMEGLVGEMGRVMEDFDGQKTGQVFLHGEIWTAQSDEPLSKNDSVEVKSLNGMILNVTKSKENFS